MIGNVDFILNNPSDCLKCGRSMAEILAEEREVEPDDVLLPRIDMETITMYDLRGDKMRINNGRSLENLNDKLRNEQKI